MLVLGQLGDVIWARHERFGVEYAGSSLGHVLDHVERGAADAQTVGKGIRVVLPSSAQEEASCVEQ